VRAVTNGCPVQSSSAPGPSKAPARESAARAARRGSRPLPRPRCLLVKDRNLLTKHLMPVPIVAPGMLPGVLQAGARQGRNPNRKCRGATPMSPPPFSVRRWPMPPPHPAVPDQAAPTGTSRCPGGASAGHGLPIVLAEHRARHVSGDAAGAVEAAGPASTSSGGQSAGTATAGYSSRCKANTCLQARAQDPLGLRPDHPTPSERWRCARSRTGQAPGPAVPPPDPRTPQAWRSRNRTLFRRLTCSTSARSRPSAPTRPPTSSCRKDRALTSTTPPCSSPDSAKDRRTSGTVCTSNVTKTRPARRAALRTSASSA
jgi:hypothetical protein